MSISREEFPLINHKTHRIKYQFFTIENTSMFFRNLITGVKTTTENVPKETAFVSSKYPSSPGLTE